MLMLSSAQAHLMVAQHGTLNIVDDGAFMVLSIPISAFEGIDDDGDGKVSMVEFNHHRTTIAESVGQNLTLSGEDGNLSLEGIMLSPVAPHDASDESISQLTVMGRFDLADTEGALRFQVGLFGNQSNEQQLEITATRESDGWEQVLELTPTSPAGNLFAEELHSYESITYPVVDTGQTHTYNDRRAIEFPAIGTSYYGQDAQYPSNTPGYKDNDDGTVSDLVTGLTWTQDPGEKKSYDDAVAGAEKCRVGGFNDWRLPTIKELYSLIQFNGVNPNPNNYDSANLTPFIDSSVFKFQYGEESEGDRIIDSQFATSTIYVSTTMNGNKTMFGVNFADGRIKGYPAGNTGRKTKTYFVLYVRGNPDYGKNKFRDNGDGTVTDEATGLTWMKADSGKGMNWPTALEYAENLELAGYDDWRLPNAKELQSIVDYTRSPDTTGSAAIDPVFEATEITNEGGEKDYGWYWSSTSHLRGIGSSSAVYVTFGRSLGWMPERRSPSGDKKLMDVHGAGSQRSDPKLGDASRFPEGRGPQGDVIRIENLVRLVRGGGVEEAPAGPPPKRK